MRGKVEDSRNISSKFLNSLDQIEWKMMQLAILLLFVPVLCSAADGSVHVTGRLLCSKAPYTKEMVRVMDYNYIASDSLMNEELTDDSGYFSVKASTSDWFGVKPYVSIPNYCGAVVNDGEQCTESVIRIDVPSAYVSDRHVPAMKFDVGTLELLNLEHGEQLGLWKIIFGNSKECRER